jgi:glucosamine-6-phosphate deaminase
MSIVKEIFESKVEGCKSAAKEIKRVIEKNNSIGKQTVLGLATGSSPIELYKELVRLHKQEGLTFKNVISFNLDEYYPMEKSSDKSYYYFMHHHLFDHIDIKPENVNIPKGDISEGEVDKFCADYESKIDSCGGIDIQILGIGRTGHIGFNEPGAEFDSVTRMVVLNDITVTDAAGDFGGKENVPSKAITMGVASVFKAKKVILFAWGEKKAEIVKASLVNEITDQVPATYLQKHSDVKYILDKGAASSL